MDLCSFLDFTVLIRAWPGVGASCECWFKVFLVLSDLGPFSPECEYVEDFWEGGIAVCPVVGITSSRVLGIWLSVVEPLTALLVLCVTEVFDMDFWIRGSSVFEGLDFSLFEWNLLEVLWGRGIGASCMWSGVLAFSVLLDWFFTNELLFALTIFHSTGVSRPNCWLEGASGSLWGVSEPLVFDKSNRSSSRLLSWAIDLSLCQFLR